MNVALANLATTQITVSSGLLIVLAFFLVALIYSAAGFGGGSSYLAILTFVIDQHEVIRSLALICNLAVVVGSVIVFARSRLLSFRTALPLVVASIPMAYLGATVDLSPGHFYRLLAITLILAAIAMLGRRFFELENSHRAGRDVRQNFWMSPAIGKRVMGPLMGGVIGLLSGLAGVGGGIFLSPALNLIRYETPKRIAGLAAFFILVNSASGLIGLGVAGNFSPGSLPLLAGLLVAVICGGQIGVRTSLTKMNLSQVRDVTAVVVLVAGIRLLFV